MTVPVFGLAEWHQIRVIVVRSGGADGLQLRHKLLLLVMIRILLSKKLGELKWTQADLARATGIRPTTISDYYNEIAERMNLNHLDLICEALDCEPDEILVRVPNPEPRVRNRTGFEKPATESKVGI